MMIPLNRDDTPPKPGPEYEIFRVPASGRLTLTIISKAHWGIWCHWGPGKQSSPCYKDKKVCPGCKQGLPHRWKAYIHVFSHNVRREGFLELTPLAIETLLSYIEEGSTMRGARIDVSRGNGQKARLKLTLNTSLPITNPDKLPQAKDPYKTLCKLWGLNDDGESPFALVG